MFVNAPSVFIMLEYSWYGQVSETDAPADTEIKVTKRLVDYFIEHIQKFHQLNYIFEHSYVTRLPWISLI